MNAATELTGIPALARLEAYGPLGEAEMVALMEMASTPRPFRKGEIFYRQSDPGPQMVLILQGWAATSIHLSDGGRQLLAVHLPGDVAGLHSLPWGGMPDTLRALTDGVACRISPVKLGGLFEQSPRVAALLFLLSQEERSMFMDRLTAAGRVDALGRCAALLLHLCERAYLAGVGSETSLQLPLTQADYADLLGLTSVHVNRVFQAMRTAGLIKLHNKRLELLDVAGLRSRALLPERKRRQRQEWLPRSRDGISKET